ncbi:hypothetical protein M8J77_015731 [Diaphorina citri]|nr:hypothetical protein M8J77_015731 [Diaphorina citri]
MINDSSCSSTSSQNASFKSVLDESYDSFDMNQSREDPSPVISQLSLEIETSCSVDMESCSDSQNNRILPGEPQMINNEPALMISEPTKAPSPQVVQPSVNVALPREVTKAARAAKKIVFSPSMVTHSPQKINTSFTCHMDCDDPASDQENVQQPPKVRSPRTPLAMINKQSNSPLNILRAKQWKDFQEEREKRGLMDSENALPPFKVTASSVPAKVPVRRRPLV